MDKCSNQSSDQSFDTILLNRTKMNKKEQMDKRVKGRQKI